MKKVGWLVIVHILLGVSFLQGQTFPGQAVDTLCADTLPQREGVVTLRPWVYRDSLVTVTFPCVTDKSVTRPLVFLPDSLIRDSLCYEYTKIKNFAYRARWTKELYKLVFVNPRRGTLNVMRTQNSEDRFKEYAGRQIRKINIKVLPPYGTSVYDTTHVENDLGWVKNFANKTHMSTAERVIARQLTLKPGDALNPFEVVQNEIMLRELDYINDATVMVSEVEDVPGQVDINIVCKDKLSWGATLESNFLNSFIIGLENKNFMKLGHVLNYEFSYRGTKDKKWGNILEYKVNSIGGSHINLRGYYRNDYLEKQIRLEAERQFFTTAIKWGGGLAAGRVYYSDDLPDRNVQRLEELFNYHFQDVWVGKSFSMPPRYTYNQNMYLTARFFTTLFRHRPEVSYDTNHFYYNRLDYFMALTYTKIKYYKANLIYDFGRTEDIPTGLLLGLTCGFENSEYENFGYIGGEGCYAHFNRETERYYAVEAAVGAYVGASGFTRGIVRAGGKHISNLCSFGGNLKFRFYNDVNYMRGIRRYPEDYLYMMDYNIRGFDSDTLRGSQKLSMATSVTFFLPYIKRGFRMSFSAFADVGALASEHTPLLKCKTYWGLGVGVNLRNDNVVVKNLSLRFCFYPTIPADGRSFEFRMSSRQRGGFYEYRVTKPQVIQYE